MNKLIVAPEEYARERAAQHARDLSYACPVKHCRARRGEPCRDTPAGTVHVSRRVLSLRRERGV